MHFEAIHREVAGIPYITGENARFLYQLIVDHNLKNVLELGIAHGTATCYMAAAVEELGEGKVSAVDLVEARDKFRPRAEELLAETGLEEWAEITRMQTGYNWFLHDKIRDRTEDDYCRPLYDLCVIDGPKNWTIDGAAFFFVDKLLTQGGWLIFDDYDWTYAEADKKRDATDGITHRCLSEDERVTPHIREVFELLVKQHPDYGKLELLKGRGWALAQKVKAREKTYTVRRRSEFTWKGLLINGARKIMDWIG